MGTEDTDPDRRTHIRHPVSAMTRRRALGIVGTLGGVSTGGCLGIASGLTEFEACPPLVAHYPVLKREFRNEVEHTTSVTAFGIGLRASVDLERFGHTRTVNATSWATLATFHTIIPWEDGTGYRYVPQTIAALAIPHVSILGRDLYPVGDMTVAQIGERFVQSLTIPSTWNDNHGERAHTDRLRIVNVQFETPQDILDAFTAVTPHWLPGGSLVTTIEYTEPWPQNPIDWSGDPITARGHGTVTDREYTVPYAESDFSFVMRFMEREGLVYYFAMEPTDSVLVLDDDPASANTSGDPDRFTPVGETDSVLVESITAAVGTAQISESVREIRRGDAIILHKERDCRGAAEADVAAYANNSDVLHMLLDFLIQY